MPTWCEIGAESSWAQEPLIQIETTAKFLLALPTYNESMACRSQCFSITKKMKNYPKLAVAPVLIFCLGAAMAPSVRAAVSCSTYSPGSYECANEINEVDLDRGRDNSKDPG